MLSSVQGPGWLQEPQLRRDSACTEVSQSPIGKAHGQAKQELGAGCAILISCSCNAWLAQKCRLRSAVGSWRPCCRQNQASAGYEVAGVQ